MLPPQWLWESAAVHFAHRASLTLQSRMGFLPFGCGLRLKILLTFGVLLYLQIRSDTLHDRGAKARGIRATQSPFEHCQRRLQRPTSELVWPSFTRIYKVVDRRSVKQLVDIIKGTFPQIFHTRLRRFNHQTDCHDCLGTSLAPSAVMFLEPRLEDALG